MKSIRQIFSLLIAMVIFMSGIDLSFATEYDDDFYTDIAEIHTATASLPEPELEYVTTVNGNAYTAHPSKSDTSHADRYWSTGTRYNADISYGIQHGIGGLGIFGSSTMSYVPLVENIYLRKGSVISISIFGRGCGHVGAKSEIFISDATSMPVTYNRTNQIFTSILLFNLTGSGSSTGESHSRETTQYYKVNQTGYYTVDGYGCAYYCSVSTAPGLCIEDTYDIYRYRYPIVYDLEGTISPSGIICGLPAEVTDPGNPEYYYEETETFTLVNPTKTGHTFKGWTGSNGSTPQISVEIPQWSEKIYWF